MIEKIKIKFGTELKPTQVSWKSQLYKLDNTQGAISQNIRKRKLQVQKFETCQV